jgi:predicted PP-loop superfamily ATPase
MLLKFSWRAVVKAVVRSDADVEVSEAKKGSGLRGKLNKVVLAYSGGLDTSVIVPWLRYICFRVLFRFSARFPSQVHDPLPCIF